jgi:glutathione S-transferase
MWVCAEVGVEFEQHHGFAFRNDSWALELNPKGTVPFIKDGDLVLNVSTPIQSVRFCCSNNAALDRQGHS